MVAMNMVSPVGFLGSNYSSKQLKATVSPSGGLTLIVRTQKGGFSCKVQRRPPADIFLNENLPPKTPCRHHVHGRHDSPSL